MANTDTINNINEAKKRIQKCLDTRSDILNLSELQLTAIPTMLIKHSQRLTQHLTSLNLKYNQITDIDPLQPLLTNNSSLHISTYNNPFWQASDILSNGKYENDYDKLQLYLHKLTLKTFPVYLPQKTILLGNHGSGKSSSLYYLTNKKIKKPQPKQTTYDDKEPKGSSTHILDVSYILAKAVEQTAKAKTKQTDIDSDTAKQTDEPSNNKPRNEPIAMPSLACYDFGGQDFYHGMYRIFLHGADNIVLLVNRDSNDNYFYKQNADSCHEGIKTELTQYFDIYYWRGLLNYMHSQVHHYLHRHLHQHPDRQTASRADKPNNQKVAKVFLLQSHADSTHKDWSLPACLYEQSQDEHVPKLVGFYHVDLYNPLTADTQDADKPKRNQSRAELEHFYQALNQHNEQTQKRYELPPSEVEFLNKTMKKITQTSSEPDNNSDNKRQYEYNARTLCSLENDLPFLFADKNKNGKEQEGELEDELAHAKAEKTKFDNLRTQLIDYHERGIVLYDKNLFCNQRYPIHDDNNINHINQYIADIKEHIVWLNPQELVLFINQNILSTEQITNKGIISQANLDRILADSMDNDSKTKDINKHPIIQLLQHHQVIYKHQYKDGIKGDIEYIIPNYLPLSHQDPSYELMHIDIGAVAFCLRFDDFIPTGQTHTFSNKPCQ